MQGNSLKKNFLMKTILTLSSFLYQLVTFPYVSRILMPPGTGKVGFAGALVAYYALFSQLGIPTYGVRVCASVRDDRDKLSRVAHELLMLSIISSAIVYIILVISVLSIPRLRQEALLILVIGTSILLNAVGMEWLYGALEMYSYIAIRSLIFKAIACGCMFLLVKTQDDYVIYGAITVLASSATSVVNLFMAGRVINMKPMNGYDLKRHLKPISLFLAMSCATTVYTNVDMVMMGIMKSDTDVGFYDAAVKVKKMLVSISASLGAVILPRASYYIEHGLVADFEKVIARVMHGVLLAVVPISVYFTVFAKDSILLLSGQEYLGAVLPMQIIMPTVLLISLSNITGIQVLVPLGKERIVFLSELVGATIDVMLNFLLIPRFSAVGAAISTLVAEICVLMVQYFFVRDILYIWNQISTIIRIVWAVSVSCIIAVLISKAVTGCFWRLIVSSVVFFFIYLMILYIMKEPEVRSLRN